MLRLCTTTRNGNVELHLELSKQSPVDSPLQPDEVLIRVEAAPINPSDVAFMLGVASANAGIQQSDTSVSMKVDPDLQKYIKEKSGPFVPCGNEGAGKVIKAGSSKEAQALIGRTVSTVGGSMYAEYKKANLARCIIHHDGVSPRQAASSFVNPMTVLGMLETMRSENHKAIIHTAAASNLGQMLQKVCLEDGIPLVNIVRKQAQEDLLREIGAEFVVRSDKPTYMKDLVEAIVATKATLAFDAIGGGETSSIILNAMEAAAQQYSKPDAGASSVYGSDVFKQVYIYGGLDRNPITLQKGFGMSWTVAGWLLPRALQKLNPKTVMAMQQRVADNVNTLFHSEYYGEISLKEAVQLPVLQEYAKQATGKKYLINPSLK